jgi:DNA-binding transcriptional MerR regulator
VAGDKHLSIGEVLVLLQEDFPDVTISKIRFLESQGLLDPDRTPSGYRKFYDADIAKLRWILRQQREHFLPLKVIKERLEEAGGALPDDDGAREDDEVDALDDGAADELAAADADDDFDLSSYLDGDDDGGLLFGAGTGTAVENVADDDDERAAGAEKDAPEEEPVAKQSQPELASTKGGRGRKRGRRREGEATAAPAAPAPVPRSASIPTKKERQPEPVPAVSSDSSPLDAGPTDMTLTPEELAAAAGLSQRQLGELEAYGLLGAPGVAGLPCYDGDDLVVARVAAGFLAHGVEARHLKRWKAAAQAEAGIYEQVIMPAGDQLRGALLRETLRDHLT